MVKLKPQPLYRRERTPDRPVRSGLLYQIRDLGFQNEALRLKYTKLILYHAWFQVSVAQWLRTAFICVITQRVLLISYRRFGTTYPQGSALRMGPIGCPEMSVRNHHYSLPHNPEERSYQFYTMFYSSAKLYLSQFIKNLTRCNSVSNFISPYLYEAQHVSGDTPPIIRSLKLHWQPLVFHMWKVVGRVLATRPTTFHVWKTRGCQCSFRLLMMGGVSPETCWASYKYEIIKILIHCCILLDFSLQIVLWCTDPRTSSSNNTFTLYTLCIQRINTDNTTLIPNRRNSHAENICAYVMVK